MHKIVTQVLNDSGYDQAMLGISLCHKIEVERAKDVALKLCKRDGGHNKFLESIQIWVLVQAPRYWWQEADTYRLATKQSESTMHTLVKELTRITNIEDDTEHAAALKQWGVENFEDPSTETCMYLSGLAVRGDLVKLKANVPEGFLQRRIWNFSYKTLRNMILQRRNHRLPHWKEFLKSVISQIDYPELLPSVEDATLGVNDD